MGFPSNFERQFQSHAERVLENELQIPIEKENRLQRWRGRSMGASIGLLRAGETSAHTSFSQELKSEVANSKKAIHIPSESEGQW